MRPSTSCGRGAGSRREGDDVSGLLRPEAPHLGPAHHAGAWLALRCGGRDRLAAFPSLPLPRWESSRADHRSRRSITRVTPSSSPGNPRVMRGSDGCFFALGRDGTGRDGTALDPLPISLSTRARDECSQTVSSVRSSRPQPPPHTHALKAPPELRPQMRGGKCAPPQFVPRVCFLGCLVARLLACSLFVGCGLRCFVLNGTAVKPVTAAAGSGGRGAHAGSASFPCRGGSIPGFSKPWLGVLAAVLLSLLLLRRLLLLLH